jgi:hypothetical protein
LNKEIKYFKKMTDYTPEINILSKDDFKPSTIVVKGILNTKLDINIVSNFLIINHIFNDKNERVRSISGSRKSIEYFGIEGIIVSVCYKKNIRRGMRTGAMNNMVSIDIQYGGKNIHMKLSANCICSVGTSQIESGKKVVNKLLEHITELQNWLNFSNSLDTDLKKKNIDWLINNLNKYKQGTRSKEIIKDLVIPEEMNSKFINLLLKYFDDFDDFEKFKNHLDFFSEELLLCDKKIECSKFTIFNSVYHVRPIKNPNFEMPLYKLAPFLANIGVNVSFHNDFSEGCNVCFDVDEEKEGFNHEDKSYKHRFTIYMTSKIRQSSPTSKDEAYKYYLAMVNLLKMFFNEKNIDFKKYIQEKIEVKDDTKIFLKEKKAKKEKKVS